LTIDPAIRAYYDNAPGKPQHTALGMVALLEVR
jgi:hypothetical protein